MHVYNINCMILVLQTLAVVDYRQNSFIRHQIQKLKLFNIQLILYNYGYQLFL